MLAYEARTFRFAVQIAPHCAAALFAVAVCKPDTALADPVAVAPACSGFATTVAGAARCLAPAESFKDCDTCPEMLAVPAGEFLMGSPEAEEGRDPAEGPQHIARVPSAFAVGKFEVTFAEWDACVAAGGCQHKPRDPGWGRGRHPVLNVSWNDVTGQYLPWLTRTTGQTYRLLSEPEWEYCARAGTTTPFSTGATISTDQANFDGTAGYAGSSKGVYRKKTLEVGSFAANAFGLYDMHGNVWEFVAGCSGTQDAATPPAAENELCARVVRGGSWIDTPRVLRSAYRGRIAPDARFIYRGFRVARALSK